ncbi:MFS transporter [Gramella sp. MT6]|uniref:MFS transporter n=1 Tax=Gramella sp. MT6 TaxID=2705471 RepID=UPI001C5D7E67|nr:MFS transporter [Gramella sp. MT6]QYA24990.1 MFS transporter [Gramella sp. MT6]
MFKEFFLFFKNNFREVRFGWTLTLLSSFGQTFLISLYVPEIIKIFGISEGYFGGIYAIATVVASFLLISLGHLIDHKPTKNVTFYTIFGLALSTAFLGFSEIHISILLVALIGLRLTGQGLLSHISQTILSRRFNRDRGKALSIATTGYSIGEALFPIIISSLLLWSNLKTTTLLCAAFLIFYLMRLFFLDTRKFDNDLNLEKKVAGKFLLKGFKNIITERKFLVIMPASFALSFTSTAFFFYQYVFAEKLNWSITLYASFFMVYAVTRFFMSFVGGFLVDRFSAEKVFKFYLIPMAIGLIPMIFNDSIIAALFFLLMAGVTTGLAGTVKTSLIAEIYGTAQLGAIRSFFNMFMVLSTAIGPLFIGIMIDTGFSFHYIVLALCSLIFIAVLNCQRTINKI